MQNEIHYAEKKELNKKATSEVGIPNNFLGHIFYENWLDGLALWSIHYHHQ